VNVRGDEWCAAGAERQPQNADAAQPLRDNALVEIAKIRLEGGRRDVAGLRKAWIARQLYRGRAG